MPPFDNDLREALRRREPPPGFAERVLARAGNLGRHERPAFTWRWAAAAAAIILVGGSLLYERHLQRVAGERAREQTMLALRLTGSKLHDVRQHLFELQRRTIELPE